MTMEKCPCCCWMTMMFPCFFAHLYLGACRRLDLPALAWRDPPKIEAFQIVSTFVRVTVLPFVDTFQHLGLWGKNGIFLNDPKSRYRFFYSYRFLRQEVRFFQLSVGVKASLFESQLSSSVFISFQRYRFSKVDMLKPVVSTQMLAIFIIFHEPFCYRLPIVLEACAGCHPRASRTCTCISSLSFFVTLIVFWAGNALAVLRCKPS